MSDSAHTEDTLLVALRATYGFTNDRPRYVCAFHVNDGAGDCKEDWCMSPFMTKERAL